MRLNIKEKRINLVWDQEPSKQSVKLESRTRGPILSFQIPGHSMGTTYTKPEWWSLVKLKVWGADRQAINCDAQ